MYQRFRLSIFLILLILAFGIGAPAPKIFLYILPFENIENDPSVDWLRQGMMDMLNKNLDHLTGIKLQDRDNLEELMSNRNRLLHQPRGTKNYLLLGKFERSLDKIKIGLQLIDVATWEEVDRRSTQSPYSKIDDLNDQVTEAVKTMLVPYLPEIETVTAAEQPVPTAPRPRIGREMEEMGASIDIALDNLEESMDYVIGARGKPDPNEPVVEEGEWVLDISGQDYTQENPELVANTEMLMNVLDDLTESPYHVSLSKPRFEYHEDNRTKMTVLLPVTYALKEHLIKDMLNSLPYNGLKQDGSLTIFYFNRDRFNFPAEAMERINYGKYRAIPVIRFFDAKDNVVAMIIDAPGADHLSGPNTNQKYFSAHYFSPLIVFTIGGWSMQVAMETVEIPATYQFDLDVNDVSRLSHVSLKFVPEEELEQFIELNL